MSEIGPTQILVMGGFAKNSQVSQNLVMIYETKQATLSVVDAPTAFTISCNTKPTLLADGSLI